MATKVRTRTSGGFAAVQRGLNIARVHTAARAVGVARAAVEDTWSYFQEREQFGQPIANFQALRFALADMAAEVAQARAFWQQVAHLLDQARVQKANRAGETARNRDGRARDQSGHAAPRRQRLHDRAASGTLLADARLTTIFEGTSEIQRRIISDRMLPKLSTKQAKFAMDQTCLT